MDIYCKIEEARLKYIRHNQPRLRAELYAPVNGAQAQVILPSTFVGGPRYMAEHYQDAMAIVRKHSKPDLFLTITCNPRWPEITENLLPGQSPNDRPDLICRVFKLKLKEFMKDLTRYHIFGPDVAFVNVVEFQKRGLPHAHILLFLDRSHKPQTIQHFDDIVSATVPDRHQDPELFQAVMNYMIHKPCREGSPCFSNGSCIRGFPKDFEEVTRVNENGKVFYKRPQTPPVIMDDGTPIDNRWIVPYNAFLLKRWNCHINVEVIASIRSVKYLFKYLHKGHDRGTIEFTVNDEIQKFVTGRYVSATEGIWRIFGFDITDRSPAVTRLSVHLEGALDPDEELNVDQRTAHETTLTGWFRYNQQYEGSRDIFYPDFPIHHVWDKSTRRWTVRQKGEGSIGRLRFVNPNAGELFYLRMLLYHIAGATSYEDLKKVGGTVHSTFKDAAVARGLCEDDNEWLTCLLEAASFGSSRQLRALFAVILETARPTNYLELWEQLEDEFSNDYAELHEHPTPSTAALLDLHQQLVISGSSLFVYPDLANLIEHNHGTIEASGHTLTHDIHWLIDRATFHSNSLNDEQQAVFNEISRDIGNSTPLHSQYFLNGTGGCGKTFLYNALIFKLMSEGKQVVAVASTGIAANLLFTGTTAHSRFKLSIRSTPRSLEELTVSRSVMLTVQRAYLMIWDEATMVTKDTLAEFDAILRKSMAAIHPQLRHTPFGGKLILFGGDWHQTLPVLRHGTASDILANTMKASQLWRVIRQLHLTRNMRMRVTHHANDDYWQIFLSTVAKATNQSHDVHHVTLPPQLHSHVSNLTDLIQFVFPNDLDPNDLGGRSILCTTNAIVDQINNLIIENFQGTLTSLRSIDTFVDDGRFTPIAPDILNQHDPPGLPPHTLHLKPNVPVMLLRNLSPQEGLCNGTLLRVIEIQSRVLKVRIISGSFSGGVHLLPRIRISSNEDDLPFVFNRLQFPVKLAFAMTINKAQGQTLHRVGLNLTSPVFAHGQLYVALSRVRSMHDMQVLLPTQRDTQTLNVVYRAII